MSPSIEVDYSGEGRVDAVVARRLIRAAGHVPGRDFVSNRPHKGKDALDLSLRGLNAGVRYGNPILALRDLDSDAPCGGALLQELCRTRLAATLHPALVLRVAVRAVEAWLLADAAGFSAASGVPRAKVPTHPEELTRPKDEMRDLLCRYGNRDTLAALQMRRRDERPTDQVLAGWTVGFVDEGWDVEAAERSARVPSLSRCLARLRELRAVIL